MKKAIAFMFLVMLFVGSCSEQKGSSEQKGIDTEKQIIGIWRNTSNGSMWEFRADGNMLQNGRISGTYEFVDGYLVFRVPAYNQIEKCQLMFLSGGSELSVTNVNNITWMLKKE